MDLSPHIYCSQLITWKVTTKIVWNGVIQVLLKTKSLGTEHAVCLHVNRCWKCKRTDIDILLHYQEQWMPRQYSPSLSGDVMYWCGGRETCSISVMRNEDRVGLVGSRVTCSIIILEKKCTICHVVKCIYLFFLNIIFLTLQWMPTLHFFFSFYLFIY